MTRATHSTTFDIPLVLMKMRTRSSKGPGPGRVRARPAVFLMILFGLIDGGRYVFMNNVLSQAAREGARVAAAEARWIGKTTARRSELRRHRSRSITAANPGAHVCPAAVTGGSNSLQADITAAANRMVAPFGAVEQRLLLLPASRDRPARQLDEHGLPGRQSDRRQERRLGPRRHDLPAHHTPRAGMDATTSASATMVVN